MTIRLPSRPPPISSPDHGTTTIEGAASPAASASPEVGSGAGADTAAGAAGVVVGSGSCAVRHPLANATEVAIRIAAVLASEIDRVAPDMPTPGTRPATRRRVFDTAIFGLGRDSITEVALESVRGRSSDETLRSRAATW